MRQIESFVWLRPTSLYGANVRAAIFVFDDLK